MTKVLLIGYNPPQLLGDAKIEAAHYRTWQFLEPILQDGHQVHLCAGAPGESIENPPIPAEWSNLSYAPISFGERGWIKELQAEHDAFQPDCIVAVNFYHCLYTTRLKTGKPIWMDIYGDILTIMQASCFRAQSDRGMSTTIGFMRQALRQGDVFSGCGLPQQHMLAGEIAMSGRLGRTTFGYDFARTILPGSPPKQSLTSAEISTNGQALNGQQANGQQANQVNGQNKDDSQLEPVHGADDEFMKRVGIEANDFVVLWCGGYNTWTDVDTLFNALESAMGKDLTVRYVSVGANSYEAPDNVYTRLLGMIENSPHKDRFSMMGWQPWTEIPTYYRHSAVGINIDALHYETIYGTRTRLVEMIAAGLPVITSLGAELSYMLEHHGAARTFEVGDWQTLADQIIALSSDPELRDQLAEKALTYATDGLSFYKTTEPVRNWVANPTLAPDKTSTSFGSRMRHLEYEGRAILRQLLWRTTGQE